MKENITPYAFFRKQWASRLKRMKNNLSSFSFREGLHFNLKLMLRAVADIFPFVLQLRKPYFPVYLLCIIISVPIVLLIRVIKPIVHIRFGRILASNIGQFILTPEIYLSTKLTGYDDNCVDLFFYDGLPCNSQVDKMIRAKLYISPFVQAFYQANLLLPGWRNHLVKLMPFYPENDVLHTFNKVKPSLSFDSFDDMKAIQMLRKIGISKQDKFVCLYVREHVVGTSPNSVTYCYDISDYQYLAEYLVAKGFFVLRMGKASETPMYSSHSKIIDYAYNYHSDLMDIWLISKCEFMVSTGGGLDAVPLVFRKPFLYLNSDLASFRSHYSNCLVNFIKIKHKGRVLSHNESIELLSRFKNNRALLTPKAFLDPEHYSIECASKEEVYAAVDEILLRNTGDWVADRTSINDHHEFWRVFQKWPLVKENFHGQEMLANISNLYLKQNKDWLLN